MMKPISNIIFALASILLVLSVRHPNNNFSTVSDIQGVQNRCDTNSVISIHQTTIITLKCNNF